MAAMLGPWVGILAYFVVASLGLFGAARLARALGGRDFAGFQLRYQSITLLLAAAQSKPGGCFPPSRRRTTVLKP